MAGALLGVAFLVRGLGDMASPGGSTLSWFSPLGWSLQTAPYVLNHWWPLWLLVALTACSVGVAFLLQSRRDLGIGWLRAGRGRPHARAHLGSPFGLAWRLQRGALLGWAAAIVVFALIDGGFAQTMLDAAAEMPPILTDMFGGTAGLADGYAAFLAEYSGYLAVAHVVFAAHILTGEEQSGRADAVLATPTSRISWAGTHYLVIAMGVVAVLTVAGLASGVAFAAVTADTAMIGTLIAAHLNLVPAVWVMVALMAVLFGWAPRLLTVVGWVAAGMVFFFGLFARIMDLPEWVIGLSPLSHPAQLPVEDFSATPLLVLTLITAAGVGLGLIGLRRRQIMNRA
ncbi:MAG: hypothetical protein GXX86_05320 [Propionibacterium sp.]|nr:hypothetical protein [Propionibacterium sp.]